MSHSQSRPGEHPMQGAFSTREGIQADAHAISVLLQSAFVEFEPLYTPEAFAATVLSEAGVLTRMDEGPVWVAESQSELIGTVAAIRMPDFIMVRGMAVAPSARGLGVGRELLRLTEIFARTQGYERLCLYTTGFLQGAIKLYQTAGFRFTGETSNPHGTELLRMVKDF